MSQTSSPRLPVALLAAPLLVACGYGHHGGGSDRYAEPTVPVADAERATIDADEVLDVDPGVGAGAFFEYESGGVWHVRTSCDVAAGVDCFWDVLVTPIDAPVQNVTPAGLESDDTVTLGSGDQLRLVASTGTDFDGFSFQTSPGAAIGVDALLDDGAANRYLFWVGDGALHSGAPSNTNVLVPNAE